jgi:hypothetical protein
MDARGVNIKERILMTRKEYSVLDEGIKDDECGWSRTPEVVSEKKTLVHRKPWPLRRSLLSGQLAPAPLILQ